MEKRTIFLLLGILLISLSTFAYDFKSGDLCYNITSDTTVAVTYQDYLSTTNYQGLAKAIIPETVTYNNTTYSVTSIGDYAFRNCSGLTEFTIPENITYLGDQVFEGCSGITSITWNAKRCQDRWKDVYYYSQLPFYDIYSQISSFTFGETVDSIPSFLCYEMSNLSSITIPENVKHIGGRVFSNCTGLTSVSWNAVNCSNDVGDGSGSMWPIFTYSNAHITSFTLGEKVEVIPGALCYGLSELTSITIPNSVKTIGSHAFRDCSGLTAIGIPENVSTIYGAAFQGCTNITSIAIPQNVRLISAYTFADCVNLSTVELPNEIDTIGRFAFSGCGSLTDFSLPSATTIIGTGCFYNCSNLTSLLLPENVTTVSDSAFYGCSGLTKLVSSSNIENIGKNIIGNCIMLDTISIAAQAFDVRNSNKSDLPKKLSYVRLTGGLLTEDILDGLSLNKEVLTTIDLKALTITIIPSNAFENYKSLQTVYLPPTITYIYANVFLGCQELSSINLLEGLTEIGSHAFEGCWKLESIDIPNSVTSIGEGAFVESGLCSIKLGSGLKEIKDWAFAWTPLSTVIIPKSVIHIGEGVFEACGDLSSIIVEDGNSKYDSRNNCNAIIEILTKTLITGCKNTIIPNDIIRIGKRAFNECIGLKTITIPEGVTNIEAEAFGSCIGLTSIVIPNSVTTIKSEAFTNCSELRSVTIGNGIRNIKEGAFYECFNIEEMHIRATTPPIVETDAFYRVSRTIPVFVPEIVVADYEAAAVWEEFYIMGEATDFQNILDEHYKDIKKILLNGQVLIFSNGETYGMMGQTL